MGLYKDCFRFEGELPDLEAVRAEAERRLGDAGGIESLTVEDGLVCAYSMLDPFTRPVVCSILQELGGQYVGLDGQPKATQFPEWAHRPIREMGGRDRVAAKYRFWAWLLGTAKPSPNG